MKANVSWEKIGTIPGKVNTKFKQSKFLLLVCVRVSVSNVDFSSFLVLTKETFILRWRKMLNINHIRWIEWLRDCFSFQSRLHPQPLLLCSQLPLLFSSFSVSSLALPYPMVAREKIFSSFEYYRRLQSVVITYSYERRNIERK